MPVLRLNTFGGALPILDDYKLAQHQAVTAKDVVLWTGALAPLKGTAFVANAALGSNPLTIYKYNNFWFEWAQDVNAVHTLNTNDPYDRVYYTGDGSGYPKVTDSAQATAAPPYPTASYQLGVPAPATAPSGAVSGAGSGTPETRYYVVTLVNSYGEEGPPSLPSGKFTVLPGQQVDLALPAIPDGNYNFTSKNIYRVNSSATGAVYQLVDQVAAATVNYSDTKLSEELGEALPSTTWDPPPTDIAGLISVPGPFLVGFRKNEILPSELGLAHAFPLDYRKSVDATIIGLGALDNGFVITTDGKPYVALGSHPASLSIVGVDALYACVAKRGIATVAGSVIYPAPRGLVRVNAGEAVLCTEGVFDQDDWEALNPSSLRGFRWRNLYVAFYTTVGGVQGGFVIDPHSPQDGIVEFTGLNVGGGFVDLKQEKLYLTVAQQIVEWHAGAALTGTWKSRPFPMMPPAPMHVLQVFADAYPVTVTVYTGGVQQAQAAVADNKPLRIAGAAIGREYQIEVAATNRVRDVWFASSIAELRAAQRQVA